MDRLTLALHVIGSFYDSTLDDAHLWTACDGLASFCGGSSIAYIAANPQTGILRAQALGVDPIYSQQYESYYASKEVRLAPALQQPAGVVMTEDMLIDRQVLRASELYNELLLPAQTPHFLFSWLSKTRELVDTVVVENTLERGAFQGDAIEAYRQLLPQTMAGATLRLSRPEGCALTVHVVPLRSQGHAMIDRYTGAMVFIVDPDIGVRSSIELIQSGMGLTPAEALLADRLFRGDSLRDAALSLQVSINTAKTQLKSIYSKTDCNSHAGLVRKLMAIALLPTAKDHPPRSACYD